jgi:tetratricopeptide (TPR) repeat protein
MAKTVLTAVLIVLLGVLVGCHGVDSGASQLLPSRLKAGPAFMAADASETDIIEQMAIDRQAYRSGLTSLIAYYKRTGDNMKLKWAKGEMKKLNKVPQYNYIVEASVAPANLRATTRIAEAELMYIEALRLEKRAKRFIILMDEDGLRSALDKYSELIRKHPSSDKIDDAAYKAGQICEHFKDYTIALLYYQRTYQWDPKTVYPARFKAAYILDVVQHRRAEALKLYQQALEKEDLGEKQKDFAEERVKELTRSEEKLKESK